MSFFLGIAFDEPLRAEVARALELARPGNPNAKWERLEKAHLTLVFTGSLIADAATVAAVVKRHAPFRLQLCGAGTFKDRVLWLGLGGDLKPLSALQAELMNALEVSDPHGAYTPHVTLARGKHLSAAPLQGFVSAPFDVHHIATFESVRGEYRIHENFLL